MVTIRTTSLTFNNSTFCPHSVFTCFVWIGEQTAIISLYSINWLVCITEDGECLLRGTDWTFKYTVLIKWKPLKRVMAASHVVPTAVQDATPTPIQPSVRTLSFLMHCHSKLHKFRYHVMSEITNLSRISTSEFWRYLCSHANGSRVEMSRSFYSVLFRVTPQCAAYHANGRPFSLTFTLGNSFTAQSLLCVYHDLCQHNLTRISPHSQFTHFVQFSEERSLISWKHRLPVGPYAKFPEQRPLIADELKTSQGCLTSDEVCSTYKTKKSTPRSPSFH